MIFIGHFLPECILLRLVVNLQPLVRQRAISTHGHKVVYLRMCVIVSNTNKRESLKIAAICKRMLNHFRPGPAPFIRVRGRLTSARVPGLITRVS